MGPINIFDYEKLAQAKLPPAVWDYYAGGSEDEVTLRENRAAFERIRLRPRVLVDCSTVDMSTTVLGTSVSMPILVAPTASHGLLYPDGECATARAVGASGTLMVASTSATRSAGEIASAATGPLWFQLYPHRSLEVTAQLVQRAEAAGYRAIALTADTPLLGRRERDVRNSFEIADYVTFMNYHEVNAADVAEAIDDSRAARHRFDTWETVDWLRSQTSLPVLVKGILTAEDALIALEHGVAGIMVSNHGGRQLDGAIPTIEALPEIVAAVAGRCEVYVDGGVRRGTDVLKALALGARAVLVGRPVLWGLAVNAEEGVRHVLELLRAELALAMTLAGRPTLASIDRSLVRLP